MTRHAPLLRLVLLLLALGIARVAAAAPSVSVEGGESLDAFLAGLAEAERRAESACAALRQAARGAPGPVSLWLVGEGEGEGLRLIADAPGTDPNLARAWARAAAELEGIGAAWGIGPHAGRTLIRGDARGWVVARDGDVGPTESDPCAALERIARQTVARRFGMGLEQVPGLDLATRLARSAAAQLPVLARGLEIPLRLRGLDLPTGDAAPTVVGPPGVTVLGVRADGRGGWTATAIVDPAARTGPGELMVFAPGRRFEPLARLPVTIVGGRTSWGGRAVAASAPTPLTPGQTAEGRMARPGTTDRYGLTLPTPGRLTVESHGAMDLVAILRDAGGETIDTADEGGGAYNFRLQSDLPAGAYTLEVRHCCAGTGEYRLTTGLEAGPASP